MSFEGWVPLIDDAIELDMEAALTVGERQAFILGWGVEELVDGRWRPQRRLLARREVRYASEAEATEAAVRCWRRTDHAARPFPVFAG